MEFNIYMKKMFGQRLRELRKKNGLTQAALGEQIGVSASAVGMYEQGHREPDNYTLLKICDIFEVSTDYLINEDLKCSIFFNPDDEHNLNDLVNMFLKALSKQHNIVYKDQKLEQQDVQRVADAIKLAVSCTLSQDDF